MATAPDVRPKDIAQRYGVSEKWVRELARQTTAGHRLRERWAWRGWDDPELQPVLRRLENGPTLRTQMTEWDLIVSAKNQITLPAASLRKLNVKPGDKLRAVLKGRRLELLPHPVSWVDYFAGIAEGLYGQTKEDVDAYLRELRGDWEPLQE